MKDISHNRWFGWLSLAIVAVYLVVGLGPFDFHPPNQVTWLPNQGGLHFEPYGIAYDPAPWPLLAGLNGDAKTSADFTVEL